MDTPFVIEQSYDATIEEVWQALTDENSMRTGYFRLLKKFEPINRFKFEFTNDGSAYKKEWQVTRVVDGFVLAHSWIYQGYPGNSEVTFTLFDEGNKTRLKLTHTGLASFPHNPYFASTNLKMGGKTFLVTISKIILKEPG